MLKRLPMPPLLAIMLAVALTAALGYVFFRSNRNAQPQDFDKLMSMEALDNLLDAVTFAVT